MVKAHFTVERIGPNSLRVTLAGVLDADAMEAGLHDLSTEMEGMAHGDMLMVDQGAEFPTLGAIGVEMRHWPQMLAMLGQLDRTALVTHNQMFRTAAAVESALVPGYEIQCFNDEGSASEWLEEARSDA